LQVGILSATAGVSTVEFSKASAQDAPSAADSEDGSPRDERCGPWETMGCCFEQNLELLTKDGLTQMNEKKHFSTHQIEIFFRFASKTYLSEVSRVIV